MSYKDCCDWDKCTICGECLVKCPVMHMDLEQAKSEFEMLLKGEVAPTVFKECTLCYSCNGYCPEGLRPYELILERITENQKSKPAMMPYWFNGLPSPNVFQDLYGSLSFGEQEILRRWSEPPPPSKEAMFVGCMGKTICHDIENSQVLKDLPKFGPADVCCGELAYRSGMWDMYSGMAERILARFSELDVDRLVCYCGSCYYFLSNVLPNVYGKEVPFELVSLYDWLLEKVEAGEVTCKRPLAYRAAVHESCYVSELGMDFADTLRKLYEAAGAETVELEHNREAPLSCGLASLARRWNLFDLMKEQLRKYREVSASGTNIMAVNCPGCFLTLFFTSWLRGIKVRYMPDELLWAFGDDITTPLAKRMPLVARTMVKRSYLLPLKAKLPLPRLRP